MIFIVQVKADRIILQRVHFMPTELSPGILYFSEEFGMAAHLCACGCGKKVFTPIGPTDWKLTIKDDEPTLYPSIGSWQLECQSHYWIESGKIEWSYAWSEEQIIAGRKEETLRSEIYYSKLEEKRKKSSIFKRFVQWFLKLFK
jgi:hypothetical protein